jgi:hypothetical protein
MLKKRSYSRIGAGYRVSCLSHTPPLGDCEAPILANKKAAFKRRRGSAYAAAGSPAAKGRYLTLGRFKATIIWHPSILSRLSTFKSSPFSSWHF